ncbi:hypothetical protein KZX46_22515 (plasmid) [Polymorphobacter sp. PAMC 29334]|nr:hypothetical protein KZX46_22515 [Polymorphobacter sp. PAMC 29334]
MKIAHLIAASALSLALAGPSIAQTTTGTTPADEHTAMAAQESSMAKASASPHNKAMHHKRAAHHAKMAATAHEKAADKAMDAPKPN